MNFFKKTILSTIFVALSVAMFAQVGVRAGITLPNLNGDAIEGDTETNLGLALAVIYEIAISDNFAIQPELAFVQKGYKQSQEYGGFSSELKVRVNNIDVPVLAKAKFGNESAKAYVAAGPTFGYAASASFDIDGEKESFDDDDWETFNRFEIGASAGAGVGIPVGGGEVFLDIRYLLGLSDLVDSDFDEDLSARNTGLNISVGFMANLSN